VEAEIGRIVVLGQPRKRVGETSIHDNGKKLVWWHTAVFPVMVGSLKQENRSPGQPRQKMRPYLQNNQSKKGWWYGSSVKL
jgi:hypothetical protein